MILSLASYCTCGLECRRNPGQTTEKNHYLKKKKKKDAWKEHFSLSDIAQEVCMWVGGMLARVRETEREIEGLKRNLWAVPLIFIMSVDKKRPTRYPVNFEQLFIFESEFHVELHFYFILLGTAWFLTSTPHSFKCSYWKCLIYFNHKQVTKSEFIPRAKRCY